MACGSGCWGSVVVVEMARDERVGSGDRVDRYGWGTFYFFLGWARTPFEFCDEVLRCDLKGLLGFVGILLARCQCKRIQKAGLPGAIKCCNPPGPNRPYLGLFQPRLSHSDVLLSVVALVVRAQSHVAVGKAPVVVTTKESTGVDGPESRNNVILRGESSGSRDNNLYSHIASPKFTLWRVEGFRLCNLGLRCAYGQELLRLAFQRWINLQKLTYQRWLNLKKLILQRWREAVGCVLLVSKLLDSTIQVVARENNGGRTHSTNHKSELFEATLIRRIVEEISLPSLFDEIYQGILVGMQTPLQDLESTLL
ncbi:hypothetical protein Tco_1401969 [Tanacetum coccineum]